MGDFIHRGHIEFKTLAPVHIGCEKNASKKEYLYDKESGRIVILQMDKVFERVCRMGLADKFEKYLLASDDEFNRYGRDLIDFITINGISMEEAESWSTEIVEVSDPGMNLRSNKNIDLFIRNARGMPYIPASGFKGMLRTALEAQYYLNDRDQARDMSERIKTDVQEIDIRHKKSKNFLKAEDEDIDIASMHKELFDARNKKNARMNIRNQKNDILRGLLVEDSGELSWEDMCICEKIDLKTSGEAKRIGVFREAIKPGITIRIPITIDSRICEYTTVDILNAIKAFNMKYLSVFASRFPALRTRGNSTTFFLGGGTGYVSKTVTYDIMEGREAVETVSKIINESIKYDLRKRHGHDNDATIGVSPHVMKCTRYNRDLLQMGACCVTGYK